MIKMIIPALIFVVGFFFIYPGEQDAEMEDNKPAMKAWGIALWLLVLVVVLIEALLGT